MLLRGLHPLQSQQRIGLRAGFRHILKNQQQKQSLTGMKLDISSVV